MIADLPAADVSDKDIEAITEAIKNLSARQDLKSCYDRLCRNGWDVYAVTNGGQEVSIGYYKKAGIDIQADHILSCDELRKAKPQAEVYHKASQVVSAAGSSDKHKWFVAAHAWVSTRTSLRHTLINPGQDLIAAKKLDFLLPIFPSRNMIQSPRYLARSTSMLRDTMSFSKELMLLIKLNICSCMCIAVISRPIIIEPCNSSVRAKYIYTGASAACMIHKTIL